MLSKQNYQTFSCLTSSCWTDLYQKNVGQKNRRPDFIDMISLWIIYAVNGQDTIEITVNGEAHQLSLGARVTDLIKQLDLAPERLAIELNLSILPRAKWAEIELKPGDRLEIVHFVGGG